MMHHDPADVLSLKFKICIFWAKLCGFFGVYTLYSAEKICLYVTADSVSMPWYNLRWI